MQSAVPSTRTSWHLGWYRLLLVAAVALVFGQTLTFGFLTWDDDLHVTSNTRLTEAGWRGVASFWRQPYERLYIPLSYTVFAAEASVSRLLRGAGEPLDPAVFHMGCLALHAINALLVFSLLRRWTSAALGAWCGALLFAVHPLQVESVAWISETRGLLGAMFVLSALWFYPREEQSRRMARYLLASGCFVLALLSKPTAVVAPVLVAVVERLCYQRSWRQSLAPMIPWAALALLISAVNKWQQPDADRLLAVPAVWQRILISFDSVAWYLIHVVVPWPLAYDYGRTPNVAMASGTFYLAWLLPVALVAASLAWGERRTWPAAWGLFLGGLLPVLGLIPFAFQDFSTVADRYMYVPMLGVALAFGGWLNHSGRTVKYIAAAGIIVVAAGLSVVQSATWSDSETLYRHAMAVNPRSFNSHHSLGNLRHREGKFDDAAREYNAALAIEPRHARTHLNYGSLLASQQRFDEAQRHFQAAIDAAPKLAEGYFKLGALHDQRGNREEALRLYARALELHPDYYDALFNSAALRLERQEVELAIALVDRAIGVAPRAARGHLLRGQALARRSQWSEAEQSLREALSLQPDLAEAHEMLGTICWQRRQFDAAIVEYDAALALRPSSVEAMFNKGAVLIEQGKREAGVECLRRALRMTPPDSPLVARIREAIARNQLP